MPESLSLNVPLVSVVVCTLNPRSDHLTQVFDALRKQTLPYSQWELIVVDNDSTESVADRFDIRWHPSARHVHEPILGLTSARLRGIGESSGGLLVYVDDDNVLSTDFLECAVRISSTYPFVGAWGGQIRPEFEEAPPEWTRPYWPLLGISAVQRDLWSNRTDDFSTAPCGAGLCVRAPVAGVYAERCRRDTIHLELDRKGPSLMSCGDTDLALVACDEGSGTGRFVDLQLSHLIPKSRLALPYLCKLAEEMAFSQVLLRWIRGEKVLPEDRTIGGSLLASVRRLRLSAEHRAIYEAELRGTRRAVERLSAATRDDRAEQSVFVEIASP